MEISAVSIPSSNSIFNPTPPPPKTPSPNLPPHGSAAAQAPLLLRAGAVQRLPSVALGSDVARCSAREHFPVLQQNTWRCKPGDSL